MSGRGNSVLNLVEKGANIASVWLGFGVSDHQCHDFKKYSGLGFLADIGLRHSYGPTFYWWVFSSCNDRGEYDHSIQISRRYRKYKLRT